MCDARHNDGQRTVGLVLGEALNVNDELLAVNTDDLAFSVLVAATDNSDLISLADGQRADVVLLPEILRQSRAHEGTAAARGSGEVGLTALPARGANVWTRIRREERHHKAIEYSPLLYFIAAPCKESQYQVPRQAHDVTSMERWVESD